MIINLRHDRDELPENKTDLQQKRFMTLSQSEEFTPKEKESLGKRLIFHRLISLPQKKAARKLVHYC